MKFTAILAFLLCASSVAARKLPVKIIKRHYSETYYTYHLPANMYTSTTTNVDGPDTTTTTFTPGTQGSIKVRGATFSLLLPDGRIAVVNCVSKFKERFLGPAGNRRSCRVPIVNNIEADFHRNKAKLIWPVSPNGKKKRSETYNVLEILAKSKKQTEHAEQ